MTLIELKKSIHNKIDNMDDPVYLEMLNSMIYYKDKVFAIPDHMKDGIRQGTEDIRNGAFRTMEDFEKKYEEWLKK